MDGSTWISTAIEGAPHVYCLHRDSWASTVGTQLCRLPLLCATQAGVHNCTFPSVLSGSFSVSQATGSLTRLFSSLGRLGYVSKKALENNFSEILSESISVLIRNQKIRYRDNSVVGRKKTTGFQDLWAVVFLCNTYLQDDLFKMHPCAYSSTRWNLAGKQLWPGKQKEKVLTVGKLMRQLQWRRELAWTTCTCMDHVYLHGPHVHSHGPHVHSG